MIVLPKYQVSTYLVTNPFSEKTNTSDCTPAEGHVTAKVGVVRDVHIQLLHMKYEIFYKMFQQIYHFQFFYANPCLNAPEYNIPKFNRIESYY